MNGERPEKTSGASTRTAVLAGVEVRSEAAYSLARIGPGASKAIPMLEKALEDEDRFVRNYAREALARIRASAAEKVEPE